MINMWVIPIASFTLAYYFVTQIIPVVKRVWKILPGKRIKPFDCVPCLSIWLSVILVCLPVEVSQYIAVIFTAGFLSIKIQ